MRNLSGRLSKKIELWENVRTDEKNNLGMNIWHEQKIKSLWAEVRPQTGSLLTGRMAESELSRTTHKIIIRYDAEVTAEKWFLCDGVRYNILYVLNPYLQNDWLEVFCEVVI